jgi:hypothetical protein
MRRISLFVALGIVLLSAFRSIRLVIDGTIHGNLSRILLGFLFVAIQAVLYFLVTRQLKSTRR